nr:hypothetical protein [Ardenticatena sp.]
MASGWYTVIVFDLFHAHEPDARNEVPGFPNEALAVEYARRRTWSSVEEMKAPSRPPDDVRAQWQTFGERCIVVAPNGHTVYDALSELDTFISTPIPPDASDWLHLYRSLLPDDFTLTYTWAAGSVPPPYHYEYTIIIGPRDLGVLRFIPDYPGEHVPTWSRTFHPPLARRILLWRHIEAADWLNTPPPPRHAEPPIGGATGTLSITANGRHAAIPLQHLPSGEAHIWHQRARTVVPESIWNEMENARNTYITQQAGKDDG